MAARMAREQLLARALQPLHQEYDYIVIDDPPSLGLITINGLTAADGIVIPVQCEYLALEGLSQLLETIHQVRTVLNSRLRVAGVLLTMADARTNLSNQVVEDVRLHFPEETFETLIPRSVRLGEAPSHGQTILQYAPESAGALAYEALAGEFLCRFPLERGEVENQNSAGEKRVVSADTGVEGQMSQDSGLNNPSQRRRQGLGRGLGALLSRTSPYMEEEVDEVQSQTEGSGPFSNCPSAPFRRTLTSRGPDSDRAA